MSGASEPDPRIYFAAERTFLAWLRTGLALMGFGFVVARVGLFLREMAATTGVLLSVPCASRLFGIVLIGLGVAVTAAAFVNYVATVRRFNRGEPFSGRPSWLGGVVAAFLVVAGIAMMLYLFTAG